jgi:hypothetical protein
MAPDARLSMMARSEAGYTSAADHPHATALNKRAPRTGQVDNERVPRGQANGWLLVHSHTC